MAVTISVGRALFRVLAHVDVKLGLSMNAILRDARSYGIPIRRTDGLKIIRSIMNVRLGEIKQRQLDWAKRIPSGRFIEAELYGKAKYRIGLNVIYENRQTGEMVYRPYTLLTNRWLSPSGYETVLSDQVEDKKYLPNHDYKGLQFLTAEHQEGWGY